LRTLSAQPGQAPVAWEKSAGEAGRAGGAGRDHHTSRRKLVMPAADADGRQYSGV
jgi:hypothetical protein